MFSLNYACGATITIVMGIGHLITYISIKIAGERKLVDGEKTTEELK